MVLVQDKIEDLTKPSNHLYGDFMCEKISLLVLRLES